MANIVINGTDIDLHERPKHSAVMAVQNFMTDWLLSRIDVAALDLDAGTDLESTIKQAMVVDPTLLQELTLMQKTLAIDQTIILSTGLTTKELTALKDDMYEDEYMNLYERAKEALGGDAADFFGRYVTNMTSKVEPALDANITVLIVKIDTLINLLQSGTSINQHIDL